MLESVPVNALVFRNGDIPMSQADKGPKGQPRGANFNDLKTWSASVLAERSSNGTLLEAHQDGKPFPKGNVVLDATSGKERVEIYVAPENGKDRLTGPDKSAFFEVRVTNLVSPQVQDGIVTGYIGTDGKVHTEAPTNGSNSHEQQEAVTIARDIETSVNSHKQAPPPKTAFRGLKP